MPTPRNRLRTPGTFMDDGIKLGAPIEVSNEDVEKALLEQAKDEPAVSRAYDHLRGAAKLASDELNQALDIDVFELLARGWIAVPSVRRAVQLSELAPGPPAIIRLDEHNINSTSHLVLSINVAQSALPELKLTLELAADIQSATLAVQGGQIELVALGESSVIARLKYKSVLLKEHATGLKGGRRDPFRTQRIEPDRRAGVDFYI